MDHAHLSFPSPCFSPEPQILGSYGLLDTFPLTSPGLLPPTGSHTGLSVSLNLSLFLDPLLRGIHTVTPSLPGPQHGHFSPSPTHPTACPLGPLSVSPPSPLPSLPSRVLSLPPLGLPASVSPSNEPSARWPGESS